MSDTRNLRVERLAFNLLQLFTVDTLPDGQEECSMDEALDAFIEALKGYDSRHENELDDLRDALNARPAPARDAGLREALAGLVEGIAQQAEETKSTVLAAKFWDRLQAAQDALAATAQERVCPDCRAERADYEPGGDDGLGAWLPMCPNCGSTADPIAATAQEGE